MFALAAENLLSPIVLSFVLGLFAALVRSDLTIPEAVAKGMSLYLLFAIGFKGGVSVSDHGIDALLGTSLLVGIVLSFALPIIAFALLRGLTQMSALDAAAVAGHYGSISIVTFVAATSILQSQGIVYEGFMVAVAAAMEAPAILSALWLASRGTAKGKMEPDLWREILFNGSIVLLLGSFAIGWITGAEGLDKIAAFIVSPFQGV
ncbi:MAG: sodium-dependent bicarbonate transport family permease, partial [Paracoccaceae bacterium]